MNSTEIVNQDAALEQLNQRLGQLKTASEIAIKDQASLIKSAEVKLDLESYIKAAKAHFEPELAPAEEKVKRLKIQMANLIQPAMGWLKSLVDRQREWSAKEREAAQKEQDRINEAARLEARKNHSKTPEPVAVAPALPKVPGIKNQTYYKCSVFNAALIIERFVKGEPAEREFLRRFITVDEQEIGKYARELKDPKAAEKAVPGCRFWSEG